MEQLDVILQKLGSAPIWQKAIGLVVVVALLGGGYWYFFLDSIWIEREGLEAETKKLEQEKKEYETRKKEYLSYRQEITRLLEEQKDVLRLLPKKDDIEQFVEALQQQIEMSGLSKTALIRDPPVPQDLFIRLPVKMTAYGTYHQFMRFFKSMGEIPRIVNIENLRLTPIDVGGKDSKDELRAEFTAVAFQYLDRGDQAKKAADATLKPIAQSSGGR
jgi:type IV pilus assembly protein PilO